MESICSGYLTFCNPEANPESSSPAASKALLKVYRKQAGKERWFVFKRHPTIKSQTRIEYYKHESVMQTELDAKGCIPLYSINTAYEKNDRLYIVCSDIVHVLKSKWKPELDNWVRLLRKFIGDQRNGPRDSGSATKEAVYDQPVVTSSEYAEPEKVVKATTGQSEDTVYQEPFQTVPTTWRRANSEYTALLSREKAQPYANFSTSSPKRRGSEYTSLKPIRRPYKQHYNPYEEPSI
ncbi:uncharacterized protein [Oscarella lobularis]|uniref:uncharacterized protein n=1 Tax=Oscarella lobularis TaxID=121494 RepID=UPI0033130C04